MVPGACGPSKGSLNEKRGGAGGGGESFSEITSDKCILGPNLGKPLSASDRLLFMLFLI